MTNALKHPKQALGRAGVSLVWNTHDRSQVAAANREARLALREQAANGDERARAQLDSTDDCLRDLVKQGWGPSDIATFLGWTRQRSDQKLEALGISAARTMPRSFCHETNRFIPVSFQEKAVEVRLAARLQRERERLGDWHSHVAALKNLADRLGRPPLLGEYLAEIGERSVTLGRRLGVRVKRGKIREGSASYSNVFDALWRDAGMIRPDGRRMTIVRDGPEV